MIIIAFLVAMGILCLILYCPWVLAGIAGALLLSILWCLMSEWRERNIPQWKRYRDK